MKVFNLQGFKIIFSILPAVFVLGYVFYTKPAKITGVLNLNEKLSYLSVPRVYEIDELEKVIDGLVSFYEKMGVVRGIFYDSTNFSLEIYELRNNKIAKKLFCHENKNFCNVGRNQHQFGTNFYFKNFYVKIVAMKRVDTALKKKLLEVEKLFKTI